MSDAPAAPEGTATPATSPAATTQPAPTEKTPNVGEPGWLDDRIAQAKRSAESARLKELGVDSFDAAKAAIAKAKELEESKKSEIEKFAEKVKNLEPEAKKAADYHAKLVKYADAEFAKLTDEQKTAVAALVGDDKTRVLDTIEALRPTWAPKPAEAAKADGSKPLPQPANTAVTSAAPSPTTNPTTDHRATWEALKKSDPFAAAQYLNAHQFEIFPHKA